MSLLPCSMHCVNIESRNAKYTYLTFFWTRSVRALTTALTLNNLKSPTQNHVLQSFYTPNFECELYKCFYFLSALNVWLTLVSYCIVGNSKISAAHWCGGRVSSIAQLCIPLRAMSERDFPLHYKQNKMAARSYRFVEIFIVKPCSSNTNGERTQIFTDRWL